MKMCKQNRAIHISIITIVFVIFLLGADSNNIDLVSAKSNGVRPYDLGEFKELPDYEDRLPFYRELKIQNEDMVGWLYIDGTNVDNVLMQKKSDKDFYIDKDFDGEYYYPGTLYISDISDISSPSAVINTYGHNMKDRSMFGSLREFTDPDFLKEHGTITVDTLNERREYDITHVMRIRVNVEGGDDFPYYTYSDFESEEEYDSFINQCDEHILYDSGKNPEYGDRFMMLTTCEYTYSDGTGRLVIMGKNKAPEPDVKVSTATLPAVEDENRGWGIVDMGLIAVIIIIFILILMLIIIKKKRK